MNQIEKIKKRIDKRKEKIDILSNVKALENDKKNGGLYKVLTGIMIMYSLFMAFAIYARKDEEARVFNNIFNTNISFSSFNKVLNKLINFRIIDNTNEEIHDIVVSSEISYLNIGDDYYTNDGNIISAFDDGVVTYVNGKDDNYTIIVEYDSGFRATYNEVKEVNVFVNDRVYSNDILGSFVDQVNIIFVKDNEKISYEEAISIS